MLGNAFSISRVDLIRLFYLFINKRTGRCIKVCTILVTSNGKDLLRETAPAVGQGKPNILKAPLLSNQSFRKSLREKLCLIETYDRRRVGIPARCKLRLCTRPSGK